MLHCTIQYKKGKEGSFLVFRSHPGYQEMAALDDPVRMLELKAELRKAARVQDIIDRAECRLLERGDSTGTSDDDPELAAPVREAGQGSLDVWLGEGDAGSEEVTNELDAAICGAEYETDVVVASVRPLGHVHVPRRTRQQEQAEPSLVEQFELLATHRGKRAVSK